MMRIMEAESSWCNFTLNSWIATLRSVFKTTHL
jgi:hypothetical protein